MGSFTLATMMKNNSFPVNISEIRILAQETKVYLLRIFITW